LVRGRQKSKGIRQEEEAEGDQKGSYREEEVTGEVKSGA
jgi:hypothetical protein